MEQTNLSEFDIKVEKIKKFLIVDDKVIKLYQIFVCNSTKR